MNKKKIIYIVGYPRSGSTILQSILNEVPQTLSVGEIKTIIDYNIVKKKPCSCGDSIFECEFWGDIMNDLQKQYSHDELIKINNSRKKLNNLNFNKIRLGFTKKILKSSLSYGNLLNNLYTLIHKSCDVIVDSSKDPMYGWFMSQFVKAEVYFIHLIRDPRACYYSYKKDNIDLNILRWSWMNWNAEYLKKLSPSKYLRIRYEDFAQQPRLILDQIAKVCGLGDNANILNGNSILLNGSHTLAGNPNRFKKGRIKIQNSKTWKDRLSKGEKVKVKLMTQPWMTKYGY